MSVSFDFSGQVVVVVGGTSGINRGIAECFARNGAAVAVASRNQEKIDDTVSALQALGSSAMGFQCDVRDFEAVQQGMQQVHNTFGTIDTLVSGAAGNFPAMLNELSSNGFRAVMEIDLLGTFHVMKAAHPYLRKPGASVINISAPQAVLPMQAQSHVCSAKAGVDMVSKTLGLEWGTAGNRVNSLIPGPIEGTEGMRRLAPTEQMLDMTRNSVALKRLGTSEDLGNAAMFLASPLASYITGAVIPVDGGWSLGGAAGLSEVLVSLLQGQNSSED